MAQKPHWKRLAGVLFSAALIGLLLWVLFRHLDQLRAHPWHFSPPQMTAGLFLLFLGNGALPLLWHQMLLQAGARMSWQRALYAWAVSRTGRYIPGKIWVVVGRVALSRGVPKSLVLWTLGIETVLDLLAGGALVLLTAPAWKKALPYTVSLPSLPLVALFLALSLFLLSPRVMVPIIRRLSGVTFTGEMRTFHLLLWFLGFLLLWGMRTLGYVLFLRGTGIRIAWPIFAGVFAFSFLVGTITPIAPGGLGVREGGIAFLLSPLLGPGVASLAALLTRVAAVIVEILILLLALSLRQRAEALQ